MGGSSKVTRIDGLEAACVAVAAMTRATKTLEGAHKGETLRLSPGTHSVDLTVAITGDLVQAEDVAVEGKPSLLITERELLAAIVMEMDDAERRRHIRTGVNRLTKALSPEGKRGEPDAKLEATLATVKADMRECAEKAGLVIDGKSSVRAGSLGGKPGVRITGTCGERTVDVEIRGGAAA